MGIIQARLFQEGGLVKAGDALYQLDPASYQPLTTAPVAALQKAEAAVPTLRPRSIVYLGLIKQNAVSKQDLDDANATLAQANADVAAEKAAVETARINLDYTKIAAPISDWIDKSSLTPGALVTASQTTVLTDDSDARPDQCRRDRIKHQSPQLAASRQRRAHQAERSRRQREAGSSKTARSTPITGKIAFAEANVSQNTGTFTVAGPVSQSGPPAPAGHVCPRHRRARRGGEQLPGAAARRHTATPRARRRRCSSRKREKVEQRVLSIDRSVGANWLVSSGIKDGDRHDRRRHATRAGRPGRHRRRGHDRRRHRRGSRTQQGSAPQSGATKPTPGDNEPKTASPAGN